MQSAHAAARDAVAHGIRIYGTVHAADERIASGSATAAAPRAVSVAVAAGLEAADHPAHEDGEGREGHGEDAGRRRE